MDYRVSYEHSLKNAPDDFIVHVSSQIVEDVPANVPRALLPEYMTDLILKRSRQIGKSVRTIVVFGGSSVATSSFTMSRKVRSSYLLQLLLAADALGAERARQRHCQAWSTNSSQDRAGCGHQGPPAP